MGMDSPVDIDILQKSHRTRRLYLADCAICVGVLEDFVGLKRIDC